MKIDDNYFTTGAGKAIRSNLILPDQNYGVSAGIINSQVINNVYGTSDEFMARFENFQKTYLRALETELDPRAAGRVSLDVLRSEGKINLSVLNKAARDRLRQTYINDILRLPTVLREAGLPNINLPSANLYRQLFRYQVDTSSRDPASLLLNSIFINVNPDQVGLKAFGVGVENIPGAATLKQVSQNNLPDLLKGKKVYTFDVETSGIFEGAQVRSMAIAEMLPSGKIDVLQDFNLSYASKQLGGINVATSNTASMSLSDFLKGNTKAIPYSPGGEEFLDQSTKFIHKLMEADVVAGHNVLFDISALFGTIQQMPGYDKHKASQEAIQLFTKRMVDDPNFVVDTLQYTRAYLNDKVNERIGTAIGSSKRELEQFRDLLYSEDFMSKIHFGGASGTSGVEAIAANTNLLHFLEKEMLSGDVQAKELFEKIYSGTHVADTDSFLQSYIAKYAMSQELQPVTTAERDAFSPLVRGAQRKILGSSAITPTTNIASVSNLSEQVFNSVITESGMKGVKIRTDIAGYGSGLLQFDAEQGGYKFAIGQTIYDIPTNEAENIIETNLKAARAGTPQTPSFLAGIPNAPNITVNQSDLNIIDLGINYTQAHQIDEITNLSKTLGAVKGAVDETSLMNRLGKTYSLFGSDPETTADAVRIAMGGTPLSGHFTLGLEDYTALKPKALTEFAEAAEKVTDPYAFLDVRSRVFSTIMADASAPYIERAKAAALANGTMDAIKYADYGDIMSEFGVSHFKSVDRFSVLGKMAEDSMVRKNIFIPLQIMEKAAENAGTSKNLLRTGAFSFSYVEARADSQSVMNAMLHLAEGTQRTDAQKLVESLFDLAEQANSENSASLGLEADALEQLRKFDVDTKGVFSSGTVKKEELIEHITDRLTSGRIGIGNIEGDAADQAYLALKRVGEDVSNDVVARAKRAPFIDTVGPVLRIGPSVDKTVARGAEIGAQIESANGQIIQFLNEAADVLSEGKNASKARSKIRRAKLGSEPNKMLEFYIKNKTAIGLTAAAIATVGLGYAAFKKYQEHKLYDETLQQQPTSRVSTGQMMNQSFPISGTINSYRRDPLVTAGVVGNLDRNKINHYKMGNDKYNHLFGG